MKNGEGVVGYLYKGCVKFKMIKKVKEFAEKGEGVSE